MDIVEVTHSPETVERADALLNGAIKAAKAGDAEQMSVCLMSSRFPDGLTRRIEQAWHRLSHEDACDVVAESIEALYEKARCEEPITDVKAWLCKAARLRALTANRRRCRKKEVPLDLCEYEDKQPTAEPGIVQDIVRREAYGQLKAAVAQVQGYNIRRVLDYLFEAVENGVFPVPAAEIAEALDLEEANVRQCVRRGYKRLREVLEAEGWSDEDLSLFSDEVGTGLGWADPAAGAILDVDGGYDYD